MTLTCDLPRSIYLCDAFSETIQLSNVHVHRNVTYSARLKEDTTEDISSGAFLSLVIVVVTAAAIYNRNAIAIAVKQYQQQQQNQHQPQVNDHKPIEKKQEKQPKRRYK